MRAPGLDTLDPAFVARVADVMDPFAPASGTEHVASLLYSLVRMQRSETVVEFGTGYTTPFLLKALAENRVDFEARRASLRRKAAAFVAGDRQALKPERYSPGEPTLPWPAYYLKPYAPRLYAFEPHASEDHYVVALRELVSELGLEDFLSLVPGASVEGYMQRIPEARRPVCLAWNDCAQKLRFFEETFSHVRDDGGLLVFHSMESSCKEFADDLRSIRGAVRPLLLDGRCELLSFLEPHKAMQRGCTLIRRTAGLTEFLLDEEGALDRVWSHVADLAASEDATE
jgi:hypothetical protein